MFAVESSDNAAATADTPTRLALSWYSYHHHHHLLSLYNDDQESIKKYESIFVVIVVVIIRRCFEILKNVPLLCLSSFV